MIPYDVVYFRAESLAEALEGFKQAEAEGLAPEYVGGGTEIVTMVRDRRIRPGALVDLNGVPECRGIVEQSGSLRFGACLTLNELVEQRRFPLLAAAASGVADHTVRNSITLGGNIAGRLPYREAVLPFLLCDGTVEIAGSAGVREAALTDSFQRRLQLGRGEALVALRVSVAAAALPHLHLRRTRDARVDYPLLTAAFARVGDRLRIAASGLCDFPVRLLDRELDGRADAAALLAAAGLAPRADMRGSAEYRTALFQSLFDDAVEALGEGG